MFRAGIPPRNGRLSIGLQYSPDCRSRRRFGIIAGFPRQLPRTRGFHNCLPGGFVKRSLLPARSSENHCEDDWKELYIAALFENDKTMVATKIAEAQRAIVARRRKSLTSGTNPKERQALDTALLSLQALANCLATTPSLAAEVRAASVRSSDIRAA
jgi:hypothetical protein